ncbi:MAG: ABC transporter ATP-binding protein [Proteobacteria bacterium]|nr:MAG: ABC transporter ATP-binding protein [Pseudomonadota bacterium]
MSLEKSPEMSLDTLNLKSVVVAGANGKQILQDITLILNPNHITVLVGPNGAGKSTLARVLADVKLPEAGLVEWAGKSPRLFSRSQRLAQMGYLTESFSLEFPVKLAEFLTLGFEYSPSERSARSNKAAQYFLKDHSLTRDIQTLSSGERQRANLARLQIQAPRFAILDEAVSQLDPHHLTQARDFLLERKSLQQGALLITHDLNFALSTADEIVSLFNGQIRFQGTVPEWKESGDLNSLFPGSRPRWIQDPVTGRELVVF